MKKRVLALVIMMVSWLAATSVLAQESGAEGAGAPRPKMFVESASFDLGDINPGSIVQHEFIIENQGQAPLELLDVRPGCGCTAASFDESIAPGGTGKVLMKMRIYQEWAGLEISKSVWLVTNDPDSPDSAQTALTLSGLVRPVAK